MRFPGFDGEWEQVTLGECSISLDYGMNSSAKNFDGVNKYIRITDIDENSSRYKSDNPVSPSGNIDEKYLVGENDVLFARTGASTGKSYLYHCDDGKLYFAGFLIRAKIRNEYDSKFIFSQTQTQKYKKWVQLMSMRSGQPGINSQEYSSFKFFLPKTNLEQQKISSFLSLIDERIHTQNKIIEELKLLKNTLSKKIFSCELNFNDQEGNRYPEWHSIALGNIGEIITGKTPSTNDLNLWNGDIQFVTPTDITESKYQYSTERTIKRTNKLRILPPKSIMYTCIASIGKMSLSMKSCVTNQQINSIIPKPEFNNEFVFYALSNISEFIKSTQSSSTMPIINKTEFSKFKISTPSLQEQTKISHFLSSIDIKIDIENNFLNKLEKQKQYLLVNLFI
ncbi:restriction endonuclease subunit S [Chryseobacterium arthrosphaerae]|uniref:restriction endonuclease subunit S n=1 Tax=Chryseobacterium arthrosphaerae TaxID=651561 RepID=UPI001F4A5BC6|nr:restriction endonuclease subunit S [Chryseobacterium arthrosphaerae]